MPQKPESEQIWNVLGKVIEQDEIASNLIKIKLSMEVPILETDGTIRWARQRVVFYFDRVVYDRHKRRSGFMLLIRHAEPRKFELPDCPHRERPVIMDCVPFEAGNQKRVYRLRHGNARFGEP